MQTVSANGNGNNASIPWRKQSAEDYLRHKQHAAKMKGFRRGHARKKKLKEILERLKTKRRIQNETSTSPSGTCQNDSLADGLR